MNWRRGFLRLWSLFFVSCLGGAGLLYAPAYMQAYNDLNSSLPQVLPVSCQSARGEQGKDFIRATEMCWYSFSSFRKFFPEYSDMDDRELNDRINAKTYGANSNTEKMDQALKAGAVLGIGFPVLALLLGIITGWVLAGFRKNRPA